MSHLIYIYIYISISIVRKRYSGTCSLDPNEGIALYTEKKRTPIFVRNSALLETLFWLHPKKDNLFTQNRSKNNGAVLVL